jgi:hypothetical protein
MPVIRDEDGSLIIALAVILVLSGLSLAVLARTISALASARLAQDSAAAVAAADTGVRDALYVLDHTAALSGTGPSFSWTASINGTPVTCAVPAPGSVNCEVGTITSTGTVNGHAHTAHVQVQRRPRWPWIIAASASLVLDGTTHTVTGALASGGQLALRNGAQGGAEQDLLGPGASCSSNSGSGGTNCDKPVVLAQTEALPDPSLPVPAPQPSPCTGIITLATGVYVCKGVVSFAPGATVSVGGPVELYVTADGSTPPTLNFSQARVNLGGTAANLVVHIVGAGVVQPGDGAAAGSFTGVLDAPRATLRSNPCQFVLNGAADLGSFNCVTGGTGPDLDYGSSSLGAVYSPTWQATSYGDATS